MNEVLKMIPDPKFGKEPSFDEVVTAAPQLKQESRFSEFYKTASKLENLTSNFGVHAAGIVISDFPISDLIPLWAKVESEPTETGQNKKVQKYITQYDMKEVEELGLT